MTAARPTPQELAAILADHKLWLTGGGGRRANLSFANLSYANLRSADLRSADLRSADLSYANLRSADLSYANLSYANLSYANLSYANLRYANLRSADLSSADLSYADLSYANLRYANLRSADLRYANLGSALGSVLAMAATEILPREGEVIGWKKCRDGVLVKVRVPPDAARSNAWGRKCRAARVTVLEVVGAAEGVSIYDGAMAYRVGEEVVPHEWNADRFAECGGGIHFYLTREEAEAHE